MKLPSPDRKIKALKIVQAVSEVFGTSLKEMSERRVINGSTAGHDLDVCYGRYAAISLISQYYTYADTVRFFGRKDHTMVIASKKKLDDIIATDKSVKSKVIKVLKLIK